MEVPDFNDPTPGGNSRVLVKPEVLKEILQAIALAEKRVEICIDSTLVETIIQDADLNRACQDLVSRGTSMRVITEITEQNVAYCKELMKVSQVVHKDKLMEGIWVVTEACFVSTLPQTRTDAQSIEYMKTSMGEVLILQKSVFDRLWARSVPAEVKIQELETGEIEKTEVFYGAEEAVKIIVNCMAGAQKEMVACTEAASIALVTNIEPIGREYRDFKRRGVRFRSIYEITKESLPYVKELTQFAEIRHLDGIKGNFAVTEKEYLATAIISSGNEPVTEVIRSTSRAVMEQHRYFFEFLWVKSVPAEQRIRELESGTEIPRIEVIEDPRKSIGLAQEIMVNTRNEFSVMFATPRTFALAIALGALETYRKMTDNGVMVRILIPANNDSPPLPEDIDKARKTAPRVHIKLTPSALNTRLTILISDGNRLMTWELRDDLNQDAYKAAGVSTYSNLESLASSYKAIFDALWNMADMYEQAENHRKAQIEFINIAAHELRTPIQPILGLAEVVREQIENSPEQATLIDAIIRNAKRLQSLQEDILEVARMESNLLQLKLSVFNLKNTIREAVAEWRSAMAAKQILLEYDGNRTDDILVNADEEKILQVLRNLLENAFKFTDRGTIRIAAKTSKNGQVVVSVRDSGTGIDQEIIPRLFEKFATKSVKGTGLGLYICRNLVESHGGRIWAENNKGGVGATFYFSLPIRPRE